MAGLRVHIVMDAELVARIDASLAEGQSRGEWVRQAVERSLAADDVGHFAAGAFEAPAPAEQPSDGFRPSQAPAPTRVPYPPVSRVHAPTCKCAMCRPSKKP